MLSVTCSVCKSGYVENIFVSFGKKFSNIYRHLICLHTRVKYGHVGRTRFDAESYSTQASDKWRETEFV
jgi:hypothetical protein